MCRFARWLSVAALLLLPLLAPALAAPDEGAVDEKQVEVWTRGDERRELDTTDMEPAAIDRLHTQMVARGFRLLETRESKPETKREAADDESDLRRDLRELLRHRGRLPEGFVPHGATDPDDVPTARLPEGTGPVEAPEPDGRGLLGASGRLLARYLEVKDDPVRGPVYASALEVLADVMLAAAEGGPKGAEALRTALVERAAGAPPEQAPVLHELVDIVMGAVKPPETPSLELCGATLELARGPGDERALEVREVPEGSLAADTTLAVGDRILAIDGHPVDPGALIAVRERISAGGQLTLRVLRRTGETVVLELDFGAD